MSYLSEDYQDVSLLEDKNRTAQTIASGGWLIAQDAIYEDLQHSFWVSGRRIVSLWRIRNIFTGEAARTTG